MRKVALAVAIVFGLVLVFVVYPRRPQHQLEVRAYFQDAQGLRAGAAVRVAGVDVGRVTKLHVRPELKEHAAEITMILETAYELKIPADSVVSLRTAGLLGETYPEIDIRHASAPPIGDGGVLKVREEGSQPSRN
jgi:phospholipid/cholesterol/gamma-HCH transport system substrate-binding protein